MNEGESLEDCLFREIKEETGLVVRDARPFFVNEVRVPRGVDEEWHIIRVFFVCETDLSSAIVLSDDHDEYKWFDPLRYREEDLMESLHPVFEAYLGTLGERGNVGG